MLIDPLLALAGLAAGVLVGLTGMGGGAVLTPLLVLGFGVSPLVAVGSDLVASLAMKPVGAAVHLRRGTVDRRLVGWLVAGSVPSAFLGVLLLGLLGEGEDVQDFLRKALGAALVLSALSMLLKSALIARSTSRQRFAEMNAAPPDIHVARTLAVGVLGGLFVGITSVGSGSLIIVLLMLIYPGLTARALVGTDLVQAVPLVASAALGHALFGSVDLGVSSGLLVGALPGVYLGARLSSRISTTIIRRVLVFVLFGSGLQLLSVPPPLVGVLLLILAACALPTWVRMQAVVRDWGSRRSGPPAGQP